MLSLFNTKSQSRFPKYSELAQLAEHLTVNQVVAGSSPAFGAIKESHEPQVRVISFITPIVMAKICSRQ